MLNEENPVSKRQAWEKLHVAVRTMTTSEQNLYERLRDAWVHDVSHVDPQDLPEEAKPKFDNLQRIMRDVNDLVTIKGFSTDRAMRRIMDETQARILIHDIVSMYDAATRYHEVHGKGEI